MADIYVFENNAGSTLLTGIGAGDTQLTVAAGEGARFPAPGAGEIAALTLIDPILGLLEIVTLTVRSVDLMTIVRGQEGTTPLAFSAGTTVSHRVTKGTLEWLQSLSAGPAGGFVLLLPDSGNEQIIKPGDAADVGLTIQGLISQTGNLQEWRNSSAAIKASIGPDGALISVEAIQGQRLKSIIAGSEDTPSIQVAGDLHGFRLFETRFAVVVDNKDSAVFEGELVAIGSLDPLSIITKRTGDLLYFPLSGGVLLGSLKLEASNPFLDLADANGPAFPGFNRVRFVNEMQAFTIELRSNAESLLANILKIPYDVDGATAVESYIAGTLATTVSAAGASSPSAKTVITREKGDARFAPLAHLSDTGDPHDVQAVQVEYSGGLGASVQEALDTLEAFPPGGVTSVFGRGGAIVALTGDYAAFYLKLAGGTLTGVLELVGGAIGDEAASANDALSIANALVVTHAGLANPHSDSLATSDKASQAEAEAGTNNDAWMTPLRAQQLIDGLGLQAPTGLLAVTEFTSSLTWTPNSSARSALIICTGGGADGANAPPGSGEEGGGAGSTAIAFIADTTVLTSETVTIGGPTGTSSVGSFTTAGGGNVDKTGGTATVGDLLIRGGQGGASAGIGASGGAGGASWWGGENAFGAGGQGDTDGSGKGLGKSGVVLILEW